jgi:hypothetical protein
MKTLSTTLLAAQKESSRTPYVEVKASNNIAGVIRLDWQRLYTGGEDDYYHATTMPDDGSLVRVRVTPPADGRKLYRQRITGPDPASDFSTWTYAGQYNAVVTATASLGAEVSIFWTNSSREIRRILSTDCGTSWGSPELIDYSPTTAIYGIAAAYKPNGDLGLFFADQSTLYVKKRVSGSWQPKLAWDKSTGDLSGAAAVYCGDWDLMVTGKDNTGNFKLWSLIYGDGGDVPAGTWSSLKEFDSAPADGNFEYAHAAMARPDVFRCFYIEKFTGNETYSRPFCSNTVVDGAFTDNLWREPVPFDFSSRYGVAVTCHGDYCWLASPNAVWRASLTPQTLDLTADVLASQLNLETESAEVTIGLRNEDSCYSAGTVGVLDTGCQIDFNPGYVTSSGNEAGSRLSFSIEGVEVTNAGGTAIVKLHAADGWQSVERWRARHQFRWNHSSGETCVKDILAFVLARAGLKLEVVSQSGTATSFCPDFSINPGENGTEIIRNILSFIPDTLFMEGNKAFLVYPQAGDDSVYNYGTDHPILEGAYRNGPLEFNRVRVSGEDSNGLPVIADSFSWEEINRYGERMVQIIERNITTAETAHLRGEAVLRKTTIGLDAGSIIVPVNCGQQLWDVIDITDNCTGLFAAKRRVIGIRIVYDTRKGQYWQRLKLGSV